MSKQNLDNSQPVVERVLDLPALLAKKSHFLLGPRQTGKTFLVQQTLKNARV
jgi:predicted AAA+ superfamily ATPase